MSNPERHYHIHFHIENLDQLLTVFFHNINSKLDNIMNSLDEVLAGVTSEGTQIDSIVSLLTGIKAQLDAALAGTLTPEQQAKVDAIFAAVEANKQKVVDAINANDSDPNT